MINIKVDDKILQDAGLFTAKNGTRYILQAVSFREAQGRLEICATDGRHLYLASRPLEEGEHIAGGHILRLPKLKKNAGICHIYSDGNNIFLECEEGRFLCELLTENFPNYNNVVPVGEDLSGLFPAEDFAFFNWESLKDLDKVLGDCGCVGVPLTTGANAPHFWQDTRRGYKITVVLMPIRL